MGNVFFEGVREMQDQRIERRVSGDPLELNLRSFRAIGDSFGG